MEIIYKNISKTFTFSSHDSEKSHNSIINHLIFFLAPHELTTLVCFECPMSIQIRLKTLEQREKIVGIKLNHNYPLFAFSICRANNSLSKLPKIKHARAFAYCNEIVGELIVVFMSFSRLSTLSFLCGSRLGIFSFQFVVQPKLVRLLKSMKVCGMLPRISIIFTDPKEKFFV